MYHEQDVDVDPIDLIIAGIGLTKQEAKENAATAAVKILSLLLNKYALLRKKIDSGTTYYLIINMPSNF